MEDKITLFLCSDCSRSFSKGMDYNRHRKTHYKSFSCTLCERAFSLKTDLARHRRTHQLRQQQFLFKCTFPECKFNGTPRKDYLWKHMQKNHRSPDMKDPGTTLRKYYNEALAGERLPEANLELLEAAYQGDEAKVKDLILAGVDISTRDRQERTAGHIAAAKGFTNLLKILIDAGIEMRGARYGCLAPLQEAAKNGDIEIIKMLLDNGADLHENSALGNLSGGTALTAAAQAGKVASVETLLEYGALTGKISLEQLSRIYIYGHVDVIRVIIAHKYQTRWRDTYSGATGLHLVVISSHLELIKEVIEMGFDVNEKDYTGKTPLTYALGNHPFRWCMFKEYNKEAADLLLDAGADIGLVDTFPVQRKHPELFAKYFNQRPRAIETLDEDVNKELKTTD
ncbi:hypothetical protein EG329_012739 [Mollisiaceae sp. DMI_Dod_QoI]|nr:hypothetical protein EG329_012739 [Helotiales sp. DMI_Dod_QoI]